MITLGIDLSADPAKTGVAVINWSEGRAVLRDLHVGRVDDEELLDLIQSSDKAGLDCPFGWPEPFVSWVTDHRAFKTLPTHADRRALRYRETDLQVRQTTGIWPLSVSSDRLGITAMRCAALLSRLGQRGVPVDRLGQDRVVEVYPGAGITIWGLTRKGYKGTKAEHRAARELLLKQFTSATPWLDMNGYEEQCIRTDDALDAVLCGVLARWKATGRCLAAPTENPLLGIARVEGWIALPDPEFRLAVFPSYP